MMYWSTCRSDVPGSIISTRVRLILVLVGPAKTAGVESTESTVTVLNCHRYSRAQLRVQRNMIGLILIKSLGFFLELSLDI